jgi:anti-sigma B factor antagonist
MASGSFEVDVRRDRDRLVVSPRGELDIATVDQLRAVLDDRAAGERVELDLSGLRFLDTSGLQLLVELHRQAARGGFDFAIRNATGNVQRVFEMAGLDRVLPFT